ncbi:MAG: DUF885 domain-containing protein [Gemmatimonadota bacterium]|nr:DUF885 domain-containing protein [Gemmatimonadota bacterium]
MKAILSVLSLAAPLLLFAGAGLARPADEFDDAVDAFFERYFAFHPTAAANAGLHEYDARLGERDADAIASWLADLRELEARFEAFDPAALSEDQRLDRQLVLREIRGERFWLEEVGTWRKNPRFYSSQMDLSRLLLLEYAPLEERMAAITGRLEAFPDLVAAARANVEDPPRPFVETALITYRGLPGFLREDLTEALAGVDHPELQARFRAARDAAVEALEAYAEDLEAEILPSADGGYALGPERYRRMNALLAGLEIPLDRLKAIGERELARLQDLGYELAVEIAGDTGDPDRDAVVAAAFDSLATDSPEPGTIVGSAAAVIGRLRSFVEESGYGTVLPGDVRVQEIPPFARTNFAYIQIPGPFEKEVKTGLYYIQPVDPSWSDEVTREFLGRNNRWAILNVSGHETYPGHYHHYNHVQRAPTKAQKLLTAYVTTEGWAHYSEEMAWREGLADRDPRLGLAVVQDALLRVVRYLASIGLHTEGMSVAEAEEMFRTVAYQDSVNARQQALRGTYDPQYLNYTLGKLMILRLLEDARSGEAGNALPGSFDLTGFHDGFMARGAPPVPWIGRRMLDDPGWVPLR